MATAPIIITTTQDNSTRSLEADLFIADQQNLDQENISATGNLNIGVVIDYDARAEHRLSGAHNIGQEQFAADRLPDLMGSGAIAASEEQQGYSPFTARNHQDAGTESAPIATVALEDGSRNGSAQQNLSALGGGEEQAALQAQDFSSSGGPGFSVPSTSSNTTTNNTTTTTNGGDTTTIHNTTVNPYGDTTYITQFNNYGGDVYINNGGTTNIYNDNSIINNETITETVTNIFDTVNNTVNNVTDITNGAVTNLFDTVNNTVNNITDITNNLINTITDILNPCRWVTAD